MDTTKTLENHIKDLGDAFEEAMKMKKYATAIRAKEIQLRLQGVQQIKATDVRLNTLKPQDIKTLLQDLESQGLDEKFSIVLKSNDVD